MRIPAACSPASETISESSLSVIATVSYASIEIASWVCALAGRGAIRRASDNRIDGHAFKVRPIRKDRQQVNLPSERVGNLSDVTRLLVCLEARPGEANSAITIFDRPIRAVRRLEQPLEMPVPTGELDQPACPTASPLTLNNDRIPRRSRNRQSPNPGPLAAEAPQMSRRRG